MGPPVCLAVAWAGWAVWTIKPTLKRNDEGPEFFRAFFLCRSHGRVMLAKKAAELPPLFLRENRVPVILISFRNRFLALPSAIAGG